MKIKVISILIVFLSLTGCKKDDVINNVNPQSIRGKIVIDTFRVFVNPTIAEYTIAYHFKERPGNLDLFSIEVAGSGVTNISKSIGGFTPFPTDSIIRILSHLSLYYTQIVGDSVWAYLRLRGNYYEQISSEYKICGQFDYKDSLRLYVAQ